MCTLTPQKAHATATMLVQPLKKANFLKKSILCTGVRKVRMGRRWAWTARDLLPVLAERIVDDDLSSHEQLIEHVEDVDPEFENPSDTEEKKEAENRMVRTNLRVKGRLGIDCLLHGHTTKLMKCLQERPKCTNARERGPQWTLDAVDELSLANFCAKLQQNYNEMNIFVYTMFFEMFNVR